MKLKKIGYELKDIAVIQAAVSFQNHRSDVNPYINVCGRDTYPIFVAPMAAVTDEKNYETWIDNKHTPVIPRSIGQRLSFEERMELAKKTFVSMSLNEARTNMIEYYFNTVDVTENKYYICVDIAHGTLSDMYDVCKDLKKHYGKHIEIMAGNVANPEAYSFYADAGIDWMRVGIGGGSRCTTSCNVSVHYPMATLLDDIYEERKSYAHSHNGAMPTKVIADGGIGWFDDIQKALALGADAVMIGKLFAQSEEACGDTYWTPRDEEARKRFPLFYQCADDLTGETYYIDYLCRRWDDKQIEKELGGLMLARDYYGMSTKRAQTETGGTGNRTAEGISKPVEVLYTIEKWSENMESYLRSCMTYTNSRNIDELRNNSQVIILGGSGDSAYRK